VPPPQCPTAGQGLRLVPVGEEAIVPETHEAAGHRMQEEAADKCVRVARHRLDTMALTTPGGKAAPPVTHVEEPMIGHGDARRIAADIGQDVCRVCQGRLGLDHPGFAVELRPQLREVLRRAQGWEALHAERGGASLE
jgi:hypothetical protein